MTERERPKIKSVSFTLCRTRKWISLSKPLCGVCYHKSNEEKAIFRDRTDVQTQSGRGRTFPFVEL